jgi:hypothetical protein
MSSPSIRPDMRSSWQRFLMTPVGDLLRGRLTGSLDVERILTEAQLPEPFPRLIADSAGRCWWAGERALLARRLAAHFQTSLSAGMPAEELIAGFSETVATIPRRDNPFPGLWSWLADRLDRRREVARLVAGSELPDPTGQLITDTVRRSRLWRSERLDVARELIEHFRDGLASAGSPQQMIESFGDPKKAARLIRRAKLRSRPLGWRLWRRTIQTLAATFTVGLVICSVFLIRFFTARPVIAHNYGLDLVATSQTVAQADRGWPFYRQAALELTAVPMVKAKDPAPEGAASEGVEPSAPVSDEKLTPLDIDETRPGDKHWEQVVDWLDENPAPLAATREGASRPRLGFIFGDPDDQSWLAAKRRDPLSIDPRAAPEGLMSVLLPQTEDLWSLKRLLTADARHALETSNSQRFLDDVQALLGLAGQLRGELRFWVVDIFSMSCFQDALKLVDQALAQQPILLDDDALRDMAHRIAGYAGTESIEPSYDFERAMLLDLMQRVYSDDGRGDGVLTREGLGFLQGVRGLFEIWTLDRHEVYPPRRLDSLAIGPALAAWAPSRRTMTGLLMENFDRAIREFQRPLWQWTDTGFVRDVSGRDRPAIDRAGYLPLAPLASMPSFYFRSEMVAAERDKTLVALALVLYQRQHGAWPERLEQLVPALLPVVPPDRFTGEPLVYRLVNGHPLLYSVGPNRRDDGGQSLEKPNEALTLAALWPDDEKESPVPSGDWILWPPVDSPAPNAD